MIWRCIILPSIEIPAGLIEDIKNVRASLFIGAGVSKEAGFPDSQSLATVLSNKAGEQIKKFLRDQPLDMVAQYLYQQPAFGKQWVRQQIIDYFESKHRTVARPPTTGHEIMTKIKWRSIITTNYDHLIEIAYESNSQCVQRVLPIYTPDPQIFRHESEVARLIKLNGSVDEAARNSKHQLVITFAEQQEASSVNKEFYDLLREEAINGPIIFIGFSTSHPGVTSPGTSPEMSLLRELLKEMGPAARWHYCVFPYDVESPNAQLMVNILKANQIHVINATFSNFLNEIFNRLSIPPTPLTMRPPISIPVGNVQLKIDADDYDKDKRHFDLLGDHLLKDGIPSVAESLNGNENWSSFYNKHIIYRKPQKPFLELLEHVQKKAPDMILFIAPPGWGKTFFLKDLCISEMQKGRPIIWLKPHSVVEINTTESKSITFGAWDSTRIQFLLSKMKGVAEESKALKDISLPYIVADNCSERIIELLHLYRALASQNNSFILIISMRDNEFTNISIEHQQLLNATKFNPYGMFDSKEEILRLIDHCVKNKVASIENDEQKEIIHQRIVSEEADTALILALQVIYDKQHRPFSEIVRSFWQQLTDIPSQQLVLRTSLIHQHGGAFSIRLYSLLRTFPPHEQLKILNLYNSCLDDQILFERMEDNEPCVYTLHSLIAQHYLKVSKLNQERIDTEFNTIVECMTKNDHDIEIIRRISKKITEDLIQFSSEQKIEEIFYSLAKSTGNDWVVCQQFAKYLVRMRKYELALAWAEKALNENPAHAPLHHTKGNVLRRWGMDLLSEGCEKEAVEKFDKARDSFAISRIRAEPDEYGYVTHLDMILFLISKEMEEIKRINLITEGIQLFRAGINTVSEEKYNLLLEDKYRRAFDLTGRATEELSHKILKAIDAGKASVSAIIFLAQYYHDMGEYDHSIEVLHSNAINTDCSIEPLVKEAEFLAKSGKFNDAYQSIQSAKIKLHSITNIEEKWYLCYWDLLISVARSDFSSATNALTKINEIGYYTRRLFPKGYFWKELARKFRPETRNFKEHAKIWNGRIQETRTTGQYGRILLSNAIGETLYIHFNPRYFSRQDFRRGDQIQFVLTILPNGLRADDINTKPFVNTQDDLYLN